MPVQPPVQVTVLVVAALLTVTEKGAEVVAL